jgi:hypothetical protein
MRNSFRLVAVFIGLTAFSFRAAPQAPKGTVKIGDVTISQVQPPTEAGTCATANVPVEVVLAEGGPRPRVALSIFKHSSFPAPVDVEITPTWITATLAGPSEFHVRVCAKPPPGQSNAKVIIQAAINGVGPESAYSVLEQFSEIGKTEMTTR